MGDDLAVSDHCNIVCVGNGGKPVGNDDQGFAFGQRGDCTLDGRLIFRVYACRGLVQDDDGRVLQHGAGNGKALLFAAGSPDGG